MRIERIEVFGDDLHYIHGTYVMSGGRVVSSLPSTVVRVLTDEEIEGWGEVCPLGQAYLPAFAEGGRDSRLGLCQPPAGDRLPRLSGEGPGAAAPPIPRRPRGCSDQPDRAA